MQDYQNIFWKVSSALAVHQLQCLVGNTSSHLYSEIRRYWARTVLRWNTAKELLGEKVIVGQAMVEIEVYGLKN